jgi:hypothetical protein
MSGGRFIISLYLFIILLIASFTGQFVKASHVLGGTSLSTAQECMLIVPVTFPVEGDYRFVERNGGQVIEVEGYNYLIVPGKPMIPSKTLLLALPPGARVRFVEVEGTGAAELPGTYRIAPSAPPLPLSGGPVSERVLNEWKKSRELAYASDSAYPGEMGVMKGSGTLRKYSYVSVSVYPLSYHPESGRLIRYDSALITVHYSLPSPGSPEALELEDLKNDTAADERAARLFVNYEDIKELYKSVTPGRRSMQETWDYVIITDEALTDAINSSGFLSWKEDLGYKLRTVLLTDTEITSQPGGDLAEQIRNFLRSCYISWGIEYVLLVGDYVTVPMRYCYPDSSNHVNNPGAPMDDSGEVPTDYYYADLSYSDSVSWDSDGDGFYGEYGQDSPDFLAEVYVGRVPTDDPGRITYTLDKLVTFEQDRGDWKDQALQAGAFFYFANEDYMGWGLMDGATCMNLIETDFMSGWTISHYSEQEGLVSSEFNWSALNHEAFTSDMRNGQYGVVNWAAHGSPNNVGRKVWLRDDGDGVPETYGFPSEISYYTFINIGSILEDDYPSILFAVSCFVGYPEPNMYYGNLGIDLLTKPTFGSSVGVLSSNRTAWIAIEWPTSLGGAESLCYEFNRYLIDGPVGPERIGEALYDSKFFCHQNYGWDEYAEYLNMFNYNLYGEPTLIREGIADRVVDNSDNDFTVLTGNWNRVNHPDAHHGDTHYIKSGDGNAKAGWRVDTVVTPGVYDVFVWKFEHEYMHLMATDVPYRVAHRTGITDWIYIDQSMSGNEWIHLGSYEFDASHTQGVMITDAANGVVIADAIKLEYVEPLP